MYCGILNQKCTNNLKAVKTLWTTLSSTVLCESLTNIDISNNSMGEEGSKAFCDFLFATGKTSLLQSVNLAHTNLSVPVIMPFMSSHLNHCLTTLDISGYAFQTESMQTLRQAVESFLQIQNIIVSHCSLTEKLVSILLSGLGRNSKVSRVSRKTRIT
mmetsp:Transcript_22208/g.28334  ORF Transcript_22208/g.28334 Transcript_22208/m.28334 type:complete len:158 (-) Transcript_22208:777-1250(-)